MSGAILAAPAVRDMLTVAAVARPRQTETGGGREGGAIVRHKAQAD